jgi:hypothetical protein
MWSLNSAEGLTCADAAAAKHVVTQRNAMSERVLRDLIEFAVGAFDCRLGRRQAVDLQCHGFLARRRVRKVDG